MYSSNNTLHFYHVHLYLYVQLQGRSTLVVDFILPAGNKMIVCHYRLVFRDGESSGRRTARAPCSLLCGTTELCDADVINFILLFMI